MLGEGLVNEPHREKYLQKSNSHCGIYINTVTWKFYMKI